MANGFRSLNFTICCVVSVILNVGTVAVFALRRRSGNMQQLPKGQDVKLFGKLRFVHCSHAST